MKSIVTVSGWILNVKELLELLFFVEEENVMRVSQSLQCQEPLRLHLFISIFEMLYYHAE